MNFCKKKKNYYINMLYMYAIICRESQLVLKSKLLVSGRLGNWDLTGGFACKLP